MKQVIGDLALGVRLAVGGSRKSWARLVLQGLGIGLGVAVLVLAASLPGAIDVRDKRGDASEPVSEGTGPAPLLVSVVHLEYRAELVRGRYVKVLSPDAPVPPGVDRLPGDGEVVVSPALAELLASEEGALLRPRLPQRVVGTIGREGLTGPLDLVFLAGDASIVSTGSNETYRWGAYYGGGGLAPILWLLSMVGVIVLLFPVLVFVSVAARLAAAQRDRRLAALRLVGAGARRVRLIASGEALASAVVGLAAGFGLFYALRPFSDDVVLEQLVVFPEDLTPAPALTVAVLVGVPVLAVATSLFSMRRTIIEPLGVVREQRPVRRRLWWRLLPTVAGAALLVSQAGRVTGDQQPEELPVVLGVVLLMFGIPVLLPWLVERVVFRLCGGTPALQLAVRRLQLDSGTAARVVGGVAVVLAGTVTLQMVLAAVENEVVDRELTRSPQDVLAMRVTDTTATPGLRDALARSAGVRAVHELRWTSGSTGERSSVSIVVGTCAALRTQLPVTGCTDGKAYLAREAAGGFTVTPGVPLAVGRDREQRWLPPAVVEEVSGATTGGYYLTPAAAQGLTLGTRGVEYIAQLDLATPDAAEHARNAVAPYSWRVRSFSGGQSRMSEVERVFGLVRQGLYGGMAVTLLLAGASMLVVGLEQVRERRRPLAVLAASGVPRATLARSLLWQNGLPLVLSTVVSVATGIGLGVLSVRVSRAEVAFDWQGIALVTAAAMALVLLVTALTLPSLRKATGALGLRTE